MRLRGTLDREAWRAALADVADRHEPLRTLFAERDGRVSQRVLPADEAHPVVEHLRATEDEVPGIVDTAVRRPFALGGDPASTELLERIRGTGLAAFFHADVPFEPVVERINPTRSLARNPLLQVMVGHHARTGGAPQPPGLRAEFLPFRTDSAKFALVFGFTGYRRTDGDAGALRCRLECATELFDHETTERIGERLRRLVAALAAAPERPVSQAGILSADERRLVLGRFNATARDAEGASLPALFARRLAQRPDAVAVVEPAPLRPRTCRASGPSRNSRPLRVCSGDHSGDGTVDFEGAYGHGNGERAAGRGSLCRCQNTRPHL
ncbi:hypothetical protein GCM10010398_57860 [Streptomyces fimbriatus]